MGHVNSHPWKLLGSRLTPWKNNLPIRKRCQQKSSDPSQSQLFMCQKAQSLTNDSSWGGHGTSNDRPLRLLSAKPASLDQLALRANHRRVSACWRRWHGDGDVIHDGPTGYVYRCSFSQDRLYRFSWRLFSKVLNEQPNRSIFFLCPKWSGLRQSY